MRLPVFVFFIKPLLRTTGIALLSLFLVSLPYGSFPLPPLSNPDQAVGVVRELLERSNLLAVAFLFLLLSLANLIPPLTTSYIRIPASKRDRALIRIKPFVGLISIGYLLIIPYVCMEYQLASSIGRSRLDKESATFELKIEQVRSEVSKATTMAELSGVREEYPWLFTKKDGSIVTTSQLLQRIDFFKRDTESQFILRRSQADRNNFIQALRQSLVSMILFILFANFWIFWPSWRLFSGRSPENLVGIEDTNDE